jgi:pimeloyl-ACP methyl ester carboxylesterase
MDQKLKNAGFTEQCFSTGEINLNYAVGPNHGPALVLIPAQIANWESYQKVLPPLSQRFQVYAVDIRGHGQSDWTTGDYSWASIGRDMSSFMKHVVQFPAIVSGNSSGGLIALWLAANLPEFISGIILEDSPVFSTEWPRFKDEDRWVYQGFQYIVDKLGDPQNRDLGDYIRRPIPVNEGREERQAPEWFVNIMSWIVRRYEKSHPGQPVHIAWLPLFLRLGIKQLSMFDPDFTRAFVDGRFYEGLDHAEALRQVQCSMLVLHGEWFRHPKYGLVGAMDDQDAARIQSLVPQAQYQKILGANHVPHLFKPTEFVELVERFAAEINAQPQRAA